MTLDPRSTATPLELQKQFDLSMSILQDVERAAKATGAIEARVNAMLSIALAVAGSADRTPPATAYEIAAEASRLLSKR